MTTEVCRHQGGSEWAYSAWKRTSGGLEVSEAERPRALAAGSGRPKRLVAEQALDHKLRMALLRNSS